MTGEIVGRDSELLDNRRRASRRCLLGCTSSFATGWPPCPLLRVRRLPLQPRFPTPPSLRVVEQLLNN
jgi:hypothetical protein